METLRGRELDNSHHQSTSKTHENVENDVIHDDTKNEAPEAASIMDYS